MSLNPKGTSTAWDSQAASNCGHPPGWMATIRCIQHRRDSAGKELSHTSASPRHRTKSTRTRKTGLRQTMSLNPKGTSSGWCSQATCKSGYPQGKMGTEPYSSKPKAQHQMNPGIEKDRTQVHRLSTQRLLAQDEEARTHTTAAIIQVRRQLSGVYNTVGTVQARNWAKQRQV